MLFDATVEDEFGRVTKVRGNQKFLDLMSENGFQIIDSLPVVTHHSLLPKDRPNEVQSITADDACIVSDGLQ